MAKDKELVNKLNRELVRIKAQGIDGRGLCVGPGKESLTRLEVYDSQESIEIVHSKAREWLYALTTIQPTEYLSFAPAGFEAAWQALNKVLGHEASWQKRANNLTLNEYQEKVAMHAHSFERDVPCYECGDLDGCYRWKERLLVEEEDQKKKKKKTNHPVGLRLYRESNGYGRGITLTLDQNEDDKQTLTVKLWDDLEDHDQIFVMNEAEITQLLLAIYKHKEQTIATREAEKRSIKSS